MGSGVTGVANWPDRADPRQDVESPAGAPGESLMSVGDSVREAAEGLTSMAPVQAVLPAPTGDPVPVGITDPGAQSRVAVIDIGSNSVRMVVFDGLARAAVPIYNEKVLCGLGRGLGRDGNLSVSAMSMALRTIDRFALLARGMQVARIDAIATAAVRDADNGRHFAQEIGRRTGSPVRVLTGEEEARLSALGVLSGIPGARGVMGDLGGGSLELVAIDGDPGTAPDPGIVLHDHATLPVGPLRLIDDAGGDLGRARELVNQRLDALPWLTHGDGDGLFYVVGGAWRSLARLHMQETDAPLQVVHQYGTSTDALTMICRRVAEMSRSELLAARWVQKRRADILPFAALILERVLERLRPAGVMFSAFGLREGVVYEGLEPESRARDPLLDQCAGMAARENRFGPLGKALVGFTAPLFQGETREELRLRKAACQLSDIGWQVHPAGRAAVTFDRVLMAPLSGVDHPGRAFIALSVYCGYGGDSEDSTAAPARRLLSPERQRRARQLGAAIRLGNEFAGRTPRMLPMARLQGLPDRLVLTVTAQCRALVTDTVERRLEALSREVGAIPFTVQ